MRRAGTWLWRSAVEHPLVAVAVVAGLVRVGFALAVAVHGDGVLIPDEAQYIGLARWIKDGRDPARFGYGYGPSLLRYTAAFVWPLVAVLRVFGPHRFPLVVFVAAFGVLTAVLTTQLGLGLVRRPLALAAGLVVALLPSQILFSSVVLREALIWFALVVLAVAAHRAADAPRAQQLLVPLLLAAGALLALGWLRDQTLVVAAWVLVGAAVVGHRSTRWLRVGGAVLLTLVVPIIGGIGPGGEHLVRAAGSSLGTVRTNLSMEADSAFAATTLLPNRATQPVAGGNKKVVTGYAGERYLVDESAGASLRAAPRGLVAVLLRPFPWERTDGSIRAAAAEDLLWYPLYGLAAVGVWAAWRRRERHLVFPAVLAAGLVGLAAVTQGNLGTSFRHRGQILWAVALFAATGVQHLIDSRRMAAR